MILENNRAFWTRCVHLMPVQHTATAGSLKEAGHNIQHSGLSATGVANQGNEFAFTNFQVNILQRNKRPFLGIKGHLHIGQFKMRLTHVLSPLVSEYELAGRVVRGTL